MTHSSFNVSTVVFEAISGPAYMTPVWGFNKSDKGVPSTHDLFYYVPRSFTDRSGWKNNYTSDGQNLGTGSLIFYKEDIVMFLSTNQTSKQLAVNPGNGQMLYGDKNINSYGEDTDDDEQDETGYIEYDEEPRAGAEQNKKLKKRSRGGEAKLTTSWTSRAKNAA